MKIIKLSLSYCILLTLMSSCFQSVNSNSYDNATYGASTYSTSNFSYAFFVIDSKCISCHDGYHDTWAAKTEENDWFEQIDGVPLVSSGSTANSLIVQRLDTWGTSGGMPKNDSPLSETEYNAIKTWIEGL